MISIADTYDVMTARDSYRDPVSSADADRRAAPRLRRPARRRARRDLRRRGPRPRGRPFAHGDDADFEAELAAGGEVAEAGEPEPQLSAA